MFGSVLCSTEILYLIIFYVTNAETVAHSICANLFYLLNHYYNLLHILCIKNKIKIFILLFLRPRSCLLFAMEVL